MRVPSISTSCTLMPGRIHNFISASKIKDKGHNRIIIHVECCYSLVPILTHASLGTRLIQAGILLHSDMAYEMDEAVLAIQEAAKTLNSVSMQICGVEGKNKMSYLLPSKCLVSELPISKQRQITRPARAYHPKKRSTILMSPFTNVFVFPC